MKILSVFISLFSVLVSAGYTSHAQQQWPKTMNASDGTVLKLYEWQPESFSNNELKARAAISVLQNGKTEPVFGVAWLTAGTTASGEQVRVDAIKITSIKLPGDFDDEKLETLSRLIETRSDDWNISVPQSELQSSLELNQQQKTLSNEINNTPPKILYSASPSILVLMDGAPKIQYNKELESDAVINTPFTIIKNQDDKFYLYGGKNWYTAPAATGPYILTTSVSQKLQKIQQKVNDSEKKEGAETESDESTIYKIIVSTEPAELIQTKGEADFAAIERSGLLYVSNTENDIFMDVNSQDYYVLLSGRWYKSKTLSGTWQYISSDKLPDEFSNIPEGSPKDNVLASVAGTAAASDALEEAEVPQTARVDRRSAKAEVMYDGQPEFETIDGTDLAYATNTSASVIRWRGRYYSVDNGIWFESLAPLGPWGVSISRPYAVALIPPRYPVYHMKYVYIYDVTPDYVWMGYTPGYLNTFIYGPTIVYGTGYHYRPWYRRHYFPRPYTWGFSVSYNPWFGWGLGFGFSTGWFNGGFYSGRSYGYGGGWWGPRNYRPSYCWSPYNYRGGYYGRSAVVYNRNRGYNQPYQNFNNNNNIYRNRGGVVSRSYSRNYSIDRGRNDRGRWSSNNNDRNRNQNFSGNSIERGNRSAGGSNSGSTNMGSNRNRAQGFDRNAQSNNRNNNEVNPSRRPERVAPPDNTRNNTPRTDNNRETYPQRRRIAEIETRPQPQSQNNNRDLRNNNNSRREVTPSQDRIYQPRTREVSPSQQSRETVAPRERVYTPQSSPRQSERRENIRSGVTPRTESNGNSRPTRTYNGGNRQGDSREGGRRGN